MDRTGIDAVADRWKRHSLLNDASFLRPEEFPSCWSLENIEELYRLFVENPILGAEGGGTFASKWDTQLEGASVGVRLLAAECLIVYYIFTETVGFKRKLQMVNDTIQQQDLRIDPEQGDQDVLHAFQNSLANPGSRYNTGQDIQLTYLIDFGLRFKSESDPKRRELLDDNPWEFATFADSTDKPLDAMRHVVCHLIYPDHFERISSNRHKSQILSAFRGLHAASEDEGIDQQLYGVRQALSRTLTRDEAQRDFYEPTLEPIWRPVAEDTDQISPLTALRRKKQIVFHGPPGTGKTYQARRVAESLIRSSGIQRWGVETYFSSSSAVEQLVESNITHLQLHPGIDYSEFVVGLRLGEHGRTEYRNGILLDLIENMQRQQAQQDLPLPHVLILDEINRTDLSAMLGEAFSAMEADKRGKSITLAATDEHGDRLSLTIPKDLYIIGTMNEIDHSVESLDFALRRRFLWFRATFDADALRSIWQDQWREVKPRVAHGDAEDQLEQLIRNIETFNEAIAETADLGPVYRIGHAFFNDLPFLIAEAWPGRRPNRNRVLWGPSGKSLPPLDNLWAFSIRPLLEQYLSGSDVQRDELERLRALLFQAPAGHG
ncbi:AAA family ATPase [Nesterenkonia sp. AY15]|uniref:McrB family protein n=1 Tax=Nesterenkonia sp. AY15 TaxID=2901139 RepID=UPI001F4CF28F|nr:AAA family ATPase [Nesterenkonia sp. AY15]